MARTQQMPDQDGNPGPSADSSSRSLLASSDRLVAVKSSRRSLWRSGRTTSVSTRTTCRLEFQPTFRTTIQRKLSEAPGWRGRMAQLSTQASIQGRAQSCSYSLTRWETMRQSTDLKPASCWEPRHVPRVQAWETKPSTSRILMLTRRWSDWSNRTTADKVQPPPSMAYVAC